MKQNPKHCISCLKDRVPLQAWDKKQVFFCKERCFAKKKKKYKLMANATLISQDTVFTRERIWNLNLDIKKR